MVWGLVLLGGYQFDFFFFQAEDGIRDADVTGVQTCALPIYTSRCASISRASLRASSTGRTSERNTRPNAPSRTPAIVLSMVFSMFICVAFGPRPRPHVAREPCYVKLPRTQAPRRPEHGAPVPGVGLR